MCYCKVLLSNHIRTSEDLSDFQALPGNGLSAAKTICVQASVDELIAGVLPDEKEEVIRALKTREALQCFE